MKRTPLARRTPLRASTPKKREGTTQREHPARNPLRRKPRPKSETERIYGSEAFREHLHRSPCLWCGREAFIVQAHLCGNDGTGRKKGWETTGPLCGQTTTSILPPCHARFDRDCAERFWFTDAQRTSILQRLEKFHKSWSEET